MVFLFVGGFSDIERMLTVWAEQGEAENRSLDAGCKAEMIPSRVEKNGGESRYRVLRRSTICTDPKNQHRNFFVCSLSRTPSVFSPQFSPAPTPL